VGSQQSACHNIVQELNESCGENDQPYPEHYTAFPGNEPGQLIFSVHRQGVCVESAKNKPIHKILKTR
jgi:hypothetical protein